jgi:peptidoglycan hydrolase-like protein with peptidoglycan-binding domain
MKITRFAAFILLAVLAIAPMAQAINNPVLPVNEPSVSAISVTAATVSVPPEMLNTMSVEQQAGIYFEYSPTQQVCIAIYPTPANCLPKKTTPGQTTVTLTGLTPNTSYTVMYKKDNTIACVMAPCPDNGLQSGSVEFTTLQQYATGLIYFSRNLMIGSRGNDVVWLQDTLRKDGYLTSSSTGYFGFATFKAVKLFQKNTMHIPPTGFVGTRTRDFLNYGPVDAVYFSGTIQAVSTGCYADGICSVTIDGRKVVTTSGRSQQIVGSIKGSVNNIGDIETSKIGAQANVYAQKTPDGYTLYGNSNYYIEVQ